WEEVYICTTENSRPKPGEMAEWSIAAVLKTVDCNRSGGSNPSFSEKKNRNSRFGFFYFAGVKSSAYESGQNTKKSVSGALAFFAHSRIGSPQAKLSISAK